MTANRTGAPARMALRPRTSAQTFAARVVSIDIHGGEGRQEPDARLTYLRGDFMVHPFADRSFDVLLCIGTLFYLPQHDAAFRKMHDLLRPGGVLIVNCINAALVRRYFGMELAEIDAKFTRSYTARELSDQLERHFQAVPDAFVQQPVTARPGRLAAKLPGKRAR